MRKRSGDLAILVAGARRVGLVRRHGVRWWDDGLVGLVERRLDVRGFAARALDVALGVAMEPGRLDRDRVLALAEPVDRTDAVRDVAGLFAVDQDRAAVDARCLDRDRAAIRLAGQAVVDLLRGVLQRDTN